jgi:hypothetical protein
MNAIDDGGPAFPPADPGYPSTRGMSLRDRVALEVFGVLVAEAADRRTPSSPDLASEMAYTSFTLADAWLKARKEG